MSKLKLGVVYGGKSTEHNISIQSANSILKNLNKDNYDIYQIFIDKNGFWYEEKSNTKLLIKSIHEYLINLDVVFPVLHGLYGEDGTIQGMLELMSIPYVGCKVLASSISMDKVYTKIIFDKAGLNQADYIYIRQYNNKFVYIDERFNEEIFDLNNLCKKIESKIGYPMFIKPSNSGSSVGINKANNIYELKHDIEYASKFDDKILIEEFIYGKEIECAILGNKTPKASVLGEITPGDEFYSFDAKYRNSTSKLTIPADIPENLSSKVQSMALKAFKAVDGNGFSRVDFFVNDKTEEIFINEINTIPGFTEISMYPKLWEASGISFSILLDQLINLAIE